MNRKLQEAAVLRRQRTRERRWQQIIRAHPEADPENIWHTLVLLELPPIERLRRGLLRGQTVRKKTDGPGGVCLKTSGTGVSPVHSTPISEQTGETPVPLSGVKEF